MRVSHIHLFGISFIFFVMGTIFSHAYMRPVWLKAVVVAGTFAYFTSARYVDPFAWVVMCAGATMGLCFAFMWVVSMYQMWISPTPSKVAERSGDSRDVG